MSTDFVDWRLAERVATAMAGSAATEPGSRRPFGPQAVRAAFEDALPSVSAYTGLQPDSEIPAAESIDRAAWARGRPWVDHGGKLDRRWMRFRARPYAKVEHGGDRIRATAPTRERDDRPIQAELIG